MVIRATYRRLFRWIDPWYGHHTHGNAAAPLLVALLRKRVSRNLGGRLSVGAGIPLRLFGRDQRGRGRRSGRAHRCHWFPATTRIDSVPFACKGPGIGRGRTFIERVLAGISVIHTNSCNQYAPMPLNVQKVIEHSWTRNARFLEKRVRDDGSPNHTGKYLERFVALS